MTDEDVRDDESTDEETTEDQPTDDQPTEEGRQDDGDANGRGDGGRRKRRPIEIARRAAGQLGELTGRTADGVSGIEPTDEGWVVLVDVVEVERIPHSTDVLATYEVVADEEGDLLRYERLHRFSRGQTDGGGA